MITEDDVVTVEMLAGFGECPFCSAPLLCEFPKVMRFKCGTQLKEGCCATSYQSLDCGDGERIRLRAKIQELERQLETAKAERNAAAHLERQRLLPMLQRLTALCDRAMPIVQDFAHRNPQYRSCEGVLQDPWGAQAWLDEWVKMKKDEDSNGQNP